MEVTQYISGSGSEFTQPIHPPLNLGEGWSVALKDFSAVTHSENMVEVDEGIITVPEDMKWRYSFYWINPKVKGKRSKPKARLQWKEMELPIYTVNKEYQKGIKSFFNINTKTAHHHVKPVSGSIHGYDLNLHDERVKAEDLYLTEYYKRQNKDSVR